MGVRWSMFLNRMRGPRPAVGRLTKSNASFRASTTCRDQLDIFYRSDVANGEYIVAFEVLAREHPDIMRRVFRRGREEGEGSRG